MAAVRKIVGSVIGGMFKSNKPSSATRVSKTAQVVKPAKRRANQRIGSFTNMSEQEGHDLADMLEAELARL